MKNIKHNFLFGVLACLFLLPACNDDFMQRDPLVELAEGTFMKNEGDLPIYLNQLYSRYLFGHRISDSWAQGRMVPFQEFPGSPIVYGDAFSDNMVKHGNSFSRLNGTWRTPQSGNNEGWRWESMRLVNYFIRNYGQAAGSVANPSALNKWLAEAYFFKAWDYYEKVWIFGDVPWYTYDMNLESPELYNPRTPRGEVMDSVLWIINFAVEHIQDNGANPVGRINRDMANFLKARIALFEGTFRKYHNNLNLGSSTKTSRDYLEECVKACEAIIATGRYQLYNAGADPYQRLFTFKNTPSSDGNREAILAAVYDGVNVTHAMQRYHMQNNSNRVSKGAPRGLIDEYLCEDGRPIYIGGTEGAYEINPLFKGYDGADWREMDNRDPRLRQTVGKPGEYFSIYNFDNGVYDINVNGIYYPTLGYNTTSGRSTTATGYQFIKHLMWEFPEYNATTMGQQTALLFRYAEVLLMLAEAKAELGTITNDDLDRTINALRTRAGYDFAKYPNARLTTSNVPADPRLDKIYAEKLDYPVTPLLREIRRERRVELVMEGYRYIDLMRWKAGNLFTVPLRGVKFTPEKQTLYNGSNTTVPVRAQEAKIGTEVFVDEDGFIIVYPRDPNVVNGVLPWDNRRYYWPITFDELMANPNLAQSPGWEDITR
jgi:hypothetical protein